MFALYRLFLYLYPPVHRREYGEEMTASFLEARADAGNQKPVRRTAFCFREITGLLCGALGEHFRFLSHSSLFAPRRFAMRPEFRFPKSATALMLIILAVVILAMEKAKSITASIPHNNPHSPPIHPLPPTLPQAFGLMFAAVYLLATAVWAVLFALRRSGIHRLSELSVELRQK